MKRLRACFRYAEEKERQTLRRLITRKEFDAVKGIDGGDEEDDDNTVNPNFMA